jgi:NAD(P)-dependent dehydrogenase (short-subunit alcohol dehydrogenase family)
VVCDLIDTKENRMTANFAGSTALVTGGNSGIGRAVAFNLAGYGAHVILSGRDVPRGEDAVGRIRSAGGKADFVAASLGDEASARKLARQAVELGGGHVDILVNNAGVFPGGLAHEINEPLLDQALDVNIKAAFLLTAAIAPRMVERGGGIVINVSTMVAELGMPGLSAYGASKAAVALLTKAWAAEYGPRGVRVMRSRPRSYSNAQHRGLGRQRRHEHRDDPSRAGG